MITKEEIEVAGEKVVLDPANLRFNEDTLSDYIQVEGGFYDNFGAHLARAEKILQYREMELEQIFAESFALTKDTGGSDRLAEARAKANDDYTNKKKQIIEAKYLVARLKNHLKAWDKNHDNAQSLGHNLRKGMEKLQGEIRMKMNEGYGNYGNHSDNMHSRYDEVDRIVKSVESDEAE